MSPLGRISATCRSFPIISVNTRPGDTETKQAWQRLKKKPQMSDYEEKPAARRFDIQRLDDAYLIISLENLV